MTEQEEHQQGPAPPWVGRHPAVEDDFDAGDAAVIVTDLAGTVTYWNDQAARLYGWSGEEAIGTPITELTVAPQDERVAEQIMECIRRTGYWQGDFWVQRGDGSRFPVHVRNSVVVDADGHGLGLLGISEEIDGRELA